MRPHRVVLLAGGFVLGLALPTLAQTPSSSISSRLTPPADAGRSEQTILQALAANPVTGPYTFSVEKAKNGRYVLSGRVGTHVIHDAAMRMMISLGFPFTDQVVIDTTSSRPQGGAGSWGPIVGSPVGLNQFIYPPPLFGRYDDPFWGLEPPLISYPGWWRAVVYRQPLDPSLAGDYPVPPVGSIAAPPGTPVARQLPGQLPPSQQPAGQLKAPQFSPPEGTLDMAIDPRGVAVLRGTVDTLAEKMEVGQRAAQTPGVTEVQNLLDVRQAPASGQPVPPSGVSQTPPPPPQPASSSAGFGPAPAPAPATPAPSGAQTAEPPAPVPQPPQAAPRAGGGPSVGASDETGVSGRVVKALERRPGLADQPIRVSLRDGVAAITGRVPTVYEAMLAYRAAQQTPGVREISDKLEFVVPNADTRNPLIDKGRPDDVEPYLQAQIQRQVGDLAHVDRVRMQGDGLVITGILGREEDRPRVEATLRSMPVLRGFHLQQEFTLE